MIIKSKSNSDFKCSCQIKVGRCKNLEHPRIFAEYLANSHQKYIERWALSKYTIWDSSISVINTEKPVKQHAAAVVRPNTFNVAF